MRPTDRRLLLGCFFLSGAAGLGLEIAWSKQLSYILGNSLWAISTVVAAFMAGLCAGSGLAARLGPRLARPLRAYALIELLIGVSAAIAIPLFRGTEPLFGALYRSFDPGHGVFLLARFLLVFVIVAGPATLMGMTLPLVVGAASRNRASYSLEAGTFYGVNTLGAVAGTLGAGFFFIPALGLFGTCLLAAAADAAIAVMAWRLAARISAAPAPKRAPSTAPARAPWTRAQWAIGILFGISGSIAMCYEVAWFRLLALTLGPSVYAFSAMLGIFLAGIGLGSAAAAPRIARAQKERPGRGAAAMGLLEAALAVVGCITLFYLNRLPLLHVRLFGSLAGSLGASGFPVSLLATTALLVLPPCLVMGALFPAAVRALQEGGGPIPAETNVGRLYTLNAGGSILGSLLAGFWLVPLLGVWRLLLFASIGSAVLGLAITLMGAAPRPAPAAGAPNRRRFPIPILAAAASAGALALAAPKYDLSLFNRGLYRSAYEGRSMAELAARASDSGSQGLLWYREGINAPVAVYNSVGDGFLKVSGKSDASTVPYDMFTQVFTGQFPILLAPRARTVALVGYGSGVSVSAALSHPEVERLDVIELEQAMIDASPWFECINQRPLDDPRVRLIVEDGRIHLTYTPEIYDVIISEPSNPWIAGIANLFTREFYAQVRARLTEGGVFGQWIQAYQISEKSLAGILRTVRGTFPHCVVFQLSPFDLMILASDRPLAVPWAEFEQRVRSPRVAASLARVGVKQPADVAFFLRLSEGAVADFVANGSDVNTDDNVWLEHRMPRELVHDLSDTRGDVVSLVARAGAARRGAALQDMLPGLPLAEVAARMTAFPHLAEPVTVPNRTSADPWVRSREVLRDGLRDEMRAAGYEDIARLIESTDARGEAYRQTRITVTATLMDAVSSGRRIDPVVLDNALQRAPDHPFAQVMMADALTGVGSLPEAEELYRRVLADPSNTTTLQALLGMSNLAWSRHDPKAAADWAQRAVDRNPFVPAVWLTRAGIAAAAGDTASAAETLRRGHEFNPGDAAIQSALSRYEVAAN